MTEEERLLTRAQVAPPKRTFLVPAGLGVEKTPEGYHLNFIITPFEAVTIVLNSEGDKQELVRQLSGGIVPVSIAEMPRG